MLLWFIIINIIIILLQTFTKQPKKSKISAGANVPSCTKEIIGFSRMRETFNLLCFGCFAAGQLVDGCFSLITL